MSETIYNAVIEVVHKETFFNIINDDHGTTIICVLDTYYNAIHEEHQTEEDVYKELKIDNGGLSFILKGFNCGDFERGIEYLRRRFGIYYVPPRKRAYKDNIIKQKDDELTSCLNAIVGYKNKVHDLETKLKSQDKNPYPNANDDPLSFEKHYAIGTLEDVFEIYLYLDNLLDYIKEEEKEIMSLCKCGDVRHEIGCALENRITRIIERRQFLYDLLNRNKFFDVESDNNE